MAVVIPALLAALAAGAGAIGTGAAAAGGALASGAGAAGGALASGAGAVGQGALAAGKGALPLLAKGGGKGLGLLKSAGSGLKPGLQSLKPGEGEPLLQGLFDAFGGTNVESTGKIGEIAKAEKMGQGGFLSSGLRRARAGAAEGLQSGLKDALMNALASRGGESRQPAQAGGVTFPTVPGPTRNVGPGIEPTPLPNHDQLLSDLALRRQRILDEILASSGGFG